MYIVKEGLIAVDEPNDRKLTPFMIACNLNKLEMVKVLVDLGANYKAHTAITTPLLMAVDGSALDTLAYLLDDLKISVNEVDNDNVNSLHIGCYKGNNDLVEYLLKKGADPSIKRKQNGRTTLHEAALHCSKEIVEKLIALTPALTLE